MYLLGYFVKQTCPSHDEILAFESQKRNFGFEESITEAYVSMSKEIIKGEDSFLKW